MPQQKRVAVPAAVINIKITHAKTPQQKRVAVPLL